MYALQNITGPAAMKVDALVALEPSDGYHMCKEDLLILTDRRGWISSPIVNVYTDYLNLRDECLRTTEKGSCICLPTYLPQLILDERCERLDACSRFVTRVQNIPLHMIRKVLIPINIDMVHWVDYLVKWFRMVKDIDISAFPIDVVVDRPLQGNSHDCGLFVMKEMEYIIRDASLDFTQKDITAMRASLLSKMLTGVYEKVNLVPNPGSLQRYCQLEEVVDEEWLQHLLLQ
ncbi:putative ubiquitin-like-specific protease 1B [Tasmannia lanceolata]|uniref:putative ubiquitin-like-specific protease 1B n=1 Tax=Tasmannia lanceolata TaxID=3420 RepID=UPI004063A3D2